MSTLYLDRRNVVLELALGRLRIRHPDAPPRDVPLALLERVVVSATTRFDSSVLTGLASRGIPMLILSPRSADKIAFVVGRPHNDVRIRFAQYAAAGDAGWLATWSRHLVQGKLLRQRRLLADALEMRPDLRRALLSGSKRVTVLIARCDATEDVDSLRGLEGAGAAAFFEAFASLFAPSLDFNGRNRRPPRDPVNAVLSLGYTLLHFEAVRAAHVAGLDPFFGYLHRPAFARESLASDLIEPVRPSVDRLVWRLFAEKKLREEHFRRDGEACLLGKAGRAEFYSAFETLAIEQRRVLRRMTRSLVRVLHRFGDS